DLARPGPLLVGRAERTRISASDPRGHRDPDRRARRPVAGLHLHRTLPPHLVRAGGKSPPRLVSCLHRRWVERGGPRRTPCSVTGNRPIPGPPRKVRVPTLLVSALAVALAVPALAGDNGKDKDKHKDKKHDAARA